MTKTSRAQIVAVARDLMREKGFAGTSMRDIATGVGLLKGSLYSHFPGKEALVPEVLALTYADLFGPLSLSGAWRRDYGATVDRLALMLGEARRCVGFHLAYGLDEGTPALGAAVRSFFADILAFLEAVLAQGLDPHLARSFARDTLTTMEGATLWLALDGDDTALQAARQTLLARADSYASPVPDPAARAVLDRLIGDWRYATLAERRLAGRLVAAERGAGPS